MVSWKYIGWDILRRMPIGWPGLSYILHGAPFYFLTNEPPNGFWLLREEASRVHGSLVLCWCNRFDVLLEETRRSGFRIFLLASLYNSYWLLLASFMFLSADLFWHGEVMAISKGKMNPAISLLAPKNVKMFASTRYFGHVTHIFSTGRIRSANYPKVCEFSLS